MAKSTKIRGPGSPAKPAKVRIKKLKTKPVVDIPDDGDDPATRMEALRGALSADILDDQAITDLMLHCASVLAFRRAISGANVESTRGLCYKGVGGSDKVTVWSNGFKVWTCLRQEAQDRGIPACG
ncbi:hypothetical protein HJA85_25150 [Rhizobium bangladeshense]|uniref:hypothetical protein n=1 Tax=Rhizobium bangladeshense TaxID=1138189 RepID=UPI001C82ED9F|nr:hypothetical protein [Rhizobium bangladeshense]MBX4870228.1 hypothetical protein [Rhizobium bangladeshense]